MTGLSRLLPKCACPTAHSCPQAISAALEPSSLSVCLCSVRSLSISCWPPLHPWCHRGGHVWLLHAVRMFTRRRPNTWRHWQRGSRAALPEFSFPSPPPKLSAQSRFVWKHEESAVVIHHPSSIAFRPERRNIGVSDFCDFCSHPLSPWLSSASPELPAAQPFRSKQK